MNPRIVLRYAAAAIAIGNFAVHAEPNTSAPGRSTAASTPMPDATDAATAEKSALTRLRFDRGAYKPGIEGLRVVRREATLNLLGAKVALNVAMSLLSGGVSLGGRSFSKDDLEGDRLEELEGDPVAVNPAISDLNDALSRIATGIYRRRVAAARDTALKDGSTPEEIEEASQIPKEADTPLHPRAWHLVYENLSGSDELFRLNFGAELGRAGFMRPPAVCAYQSEPFEWTVWQANQWQRLRDERAKAVAHCTSVLAETPEKRW